MGTKMICRICKKRINLKHWNAGMQAKLKGDRLCFDCHFWVMDVFPSNHIRYKNDAYTIADENAPGFRGFGGRKIQFTLENVSTVTSTNVWYRGEIPERFRGFSWKTAVAMAYLHKPLKLEV